MFFLIQIIEERRGLVIVESNRDVYKEYLEERVIVLDCDVDDSLIVEAILPIIRFNEEDDSFESDPNINYNRENNPIRIFINTNGGSTTAALSLVSTIESSKTPVYTIALGKAYSAGFLILAAGHKRFAQKYTRLLYHQVHISYDRNSHTMSKQIDVTEEIKYLNETCHKVILSRTKIKSKELNECDNHNKDWCMSSSDALKYNVIDGII